MSESFNYANGGKVQSFFTRLEDWLNSQNLSEIILVATSIILMFKTAINLVAVFYDSRTLLVDYMGYFLLTNGSNEPEFFKWCFIFTNIAVFLLSCFCIALCFVEQTNELKSGILRYFVQCQLVLAVVVVIFMAKLWFAPLKLKLDETEWKRAISEYNYKFEADSNGFLPNVGPDFNGYSTKIDRLQQALGCCGYSGPNDWKVLNDAALLAPSCCKDPVSVDTETIVINQSPNTKNATSKNSRIASIQTNPKQATFLETLLRFNWWPWVGLSSDEMRNQPHGLIETFFYCQSNSWALQRWPMSDLQEFGLGPAGAVEPLGCQRLMNNREVLFTFNLRLSLLILLGTQVLIILCALNLYGASKKTCQQQQEFFKPREWFTFAIIPPQIKPTQLSHWLHGHLNESYLDDSSFSTPKQRPTKLIKS